MYVSKKQAKEIACVMCYVQRREESKTRAIEHYRKTYTLILHSGSLYGHICM